MASFTPPLGSSSPEVLADNATRLDKLMNGRELTVPDRSGEAMKSWFAIQDGFDKIVSSLDTASFTFPSEPAGTAAVTEGQYFRVPQGATSNNAFIYYRKVSGAATVVAITKGAEIYGTRLLATDSIDLLPGGHYYLTRGDLNTVVASGNAQTLGYPADMKTGGSAVLTVTRTGTSMSRYQVLELTTQGLVYFRQYDGSAMTPWVNVNQVSVNMAFRKRILATDNITEVTPQKYYIAAADIAAIVSAGTAEQLGYPADMKAVGSASLDVVGNDGLTAFYQTLTFHKQGVIYVRQTSFGATEPWININAAVQAAAFAQAKAYSDANFYPIDSTPVENFPYADLKTAPNYVSSVSDWKITADGSGKNVLTVTGPTAGVAAYAGWTYPRAGLKGSFTVKGSGYKIVSGSAFVVRLRFLKGATIVNTYDLTPVLAADGTYGFERTIAGISDEADSVRVSVVIESTRTPGVVTAPEVTFFSMLEAPSASIDEKIETQVSEQLDEVLPSAVSDEVAKQLPDVKSSDAFAAAVRNGSVILRNDNSIWDRKADNSNMSWWGSSSIERMDGQLKTMATQLGISSTYNGGGSGEMYQHHSARLGSIPALLTVPGGIIPASGAVAVTVTNFISQNIGSLKAFTGYLNGVLGTLAYNASASTRFTFTRSVTGSAVTVSPSTVFEFTPSYDRKFVTGFVILNWGKNNMTYATNTVSEIMDATDKAFNFVKPFFKRVLLINQYGNTNANDVTLGMIKDYNARLLDRYGDLSIDNYGYLMGAKIWTDLGITPTATDLASQAKGAIAPSLSADGFHMNFPVSQQLITQLVKPRIQELWFS